MERDHHTRQPRVGSDNSAGKSKRARPHGTHKYGAVVFRVRVTELLVYTFMNDTGRIFLSFANVDASFLNWVDYFLVMELVL